MEHTHPAYLIALLSVCSFLHAVCPVNSLQFLSFNRTLLPLGNVRASSEDAVSNPIQLFVEQYSQPWCSAVNDGSNPNLHINFTFSEPVVITFLQSNGFFNAFVDRFSMQYALGEEGEDFMPYGVLQDQQVPQCQWVWGHVSEDNVLITQIMFPYRISP